MVDEGSRHWGTARIATTRSADWPTQLRAPQTRDWPADYEDPGQRLGKGPGGSLSAGAGTMIPSASRSRGHRDSPGVATTSPRSGHRYAATRLVTSRAGPPRIGPACVLEPECTDSDARLRPERPVGGAGARPSEAAEGLKIRQLIRSAKHESVERRNLKL